MTRIAVVGASGRTGRHVVACLADASDLELVAATCGPDSPVLGLDAGRLAGVPDLGVQLAALSAQSLARADVVIDFSAPQALSQLLDLLDRQALVSGTTGLDGALQARLQARATDAAVLQASNFSTGIAVLRDLVARAAALLPDYDLELIEAHHRHKVDAPSGTALTLARAAAHARGVPLDDVAVHGRVGQVGPRSPSEIGIHAIRGGGVVGDHELWLVGDTERLSLGHVAISRAAFAAGAIRAARWLVAQPPGAYSLPDALGLTSA